MNRNTHSALKSIFMQRSNSSVIFIPQFWSVNINQFRDKELFTLPLWNKHCSGKVTKYFSAIVEFWGQPHLTWQKDTKAIALQVFYGMLYFWSTELMVSGFPVPEYLSAAAAHIWLNRLVTELLDLKIKYIILSMHLISPGPNSLQTAAPSTPTPLLAASLHWKEGISSTVANALLSFCSTQKHFSATNLA